MSQRTVLIRKPQLHGNVVRMTRATVLSENGDKLRVIPEGQSTVIEVKASDVRDAVPVFGSHLQTQRGMVVQRALPDSRNSLSSILEQRGF